MTRDAIRIALAGTTIAASLAAAPAPALAQTAAAGASAVGLEEIVVTATRREERLQDVPISISAFSQEKLDQQGLKSIDDLTRLSPGVAFSRNGMASSGNYNDEGTDLNIRGVDSTAGTSTVGIYVDDTPIQSRHIGFGAVNAFPALFDLDRVEVLRGPQGTLFGAGAEGGALRFITPAPNLIKDSGYLRSDVSTTKNGDPSYEFGAATGGPLIDNVLGFRLSASYRRDGGWVDRVNYTRTATDPTDPTVTYAGTTEKASNYWETMTLRAALSWKASDTVTVTPSFYYQRLYVNDTAAYWPVLSDPGSGVFRNGNFRTNPSTDPFYLGAVKVEWDLGFASLVSNTSYMSRDQHSVSDYTQYLRANYQAFGFLPSTYPPAGASGAAVFGDSQRNFYQEIRLASTDKTSRISWNAGIFYSHLNENVAENIYDQTINAEAGGQICGTDPVCLSEGLLSYNPVNRVIDKQLAAFGEVGIKLTDTVTATLGVRYSKVDYEATIYNGGVFVGELIQGTSSASEKPVTPKVALTWKPNQENMFYAAAAKGYRVGGINDGVGQNCEQDLKAYGLPVDPATGLHIAPKGFNSDSLWSFEIGAKNTLFDHRLQVNSSIFQIDWKNIQQSVYLSHCGEGFSANLGKAKSIGGDIQLQFKATDALLIDFTASYVDAKYTKNSCAGSLVASGLQCIDPANPGTAPFQPIVTAGDRLLGAPWNFLTSLEYRLADWHDRTPYIRVDYQYQTAQTALLPSLNPNDYGDNTLPGLPVNQNLNLRGGLRFNGVDVSLYAQNLTNAHPALFNSRDIAWPNDVLYYARGVRPRTIGITGTYRY